MGTWSLGSKAHESIQLHHTTVLDLLGNGRKLVFFGSVVTGMAEPTPSAGPDLNQPASGFSYDSIVLSMSHTVSSFLGHIYLLKDLIS